MYSLLYRHSLHFKVNREDIYRHNVTLRNRRKRTSTWVPEYIYIINNNRQWGRKEIAKKKYILKKNFFDNHSRDVGGRGVVRMRSPIGTRVNTPLSGPEFQLRCIFSCQKTSVFLSTTGPTGCIWEGKRVVGNSVAFIYLFFFESIEARGMFCALIHSRSPASLLI